MLVQCGPSKTRPGCRSALTHQEHAQRQGRRHRLYEKNAPAHAAGTVYAGDDDAAEEKDVDAGTTGSEPQPPYQACRQEPVVESLVCRKCLGGGRKFRCRAEDLAALGLVPKEHFEDK